MPRILRGLADGYVYHVLNRGNGRQEVFHKESDYDAFLGLMKEAKEHYPINIFAYCLMPNHFHMVLMAKRRENLSKWVHWTMTSHVRHYHRHYGTSGHIWEGRFKSFIIKKDEHLLTVLRYVEGNPVRARLSGTAKDWLWSSHGEVVGNRPRMLVDEVPVVLPSEWDRYVDEPLSEREIEELRQSVNRQTPYGDLKWQGRTVRRFGLESTLRPRGRPKKGI